MPLNAPSLLMLSHLSIGYGSPLHSDISLSVRPGEILALIGPNGSGKSTLLKTIIRQLAPIEGAVFLDSAELTSYTQKELSKKMSVLLTSSVKPELLTCRDVVASGRYPHTGYFGVLSSEDEKAVDEAIHLVHAEDFASKDFMRVSDGQKQRIMFARALCQNPKLLVLDEPTSYLDIKWRLELLSILRNLSARGVTVIASLHEIDLALKISSRILCVGKGEIRELSRNLPDCKAQIRALYDLSGDFFDTEPGYLQLVQNFCKKQVGAVPPSLQPSASLPFSATPSPKGQSPLKSPVSLMIQGTMSNAGKSFIVAGLCRIFSQDGFSVAPFKSQNMALNSFVTDEGLEMGRAQVMQAEAAGVEPSVLMNPILLKPTSDTGSQVIVNGEVFGNMGAKDYFAFKKSLVPHIKSAYERLSSAHDIIVLEGAGSPAEINLKENDIVNMGMAEIADSPVLLVADIDRGGVFAQLVGTVELLAPHERSRVKGFIINKFRGDESILESGIKMLEEKTGIPVIGCVPYMKIQLDDEDSLSENLHTLTKFRDKKDEVQLAVVCLPHISNFTDFNPLAEHAGVNLYYAEKPKGLGSPDCIILPGTKNTLADLEWLSSSGLSELIQTEAKNGTPIVGICGGFQMLGEKITGNEETESVSCVKALGLLPVETEFSSEKTRTRVFGKLKIENGNRERRLAGKTCETGFERVSEQLCCEGKTENCDSSDDAALFSSLSSLPVSGYEIHMGRTHFVEGAEASYFSQITDSVSGEEKNDGAVKGNVFGTYIHGLFDESDFAQKFIEILAKRKGFALSETVQNESEISGGESRSQILNGNPQSARNLREFKESQYNLLADTLRKHLDMQKIYEIMGLKH